MDLNYFLFFRCGFFKGYNGVEFDFEFWVLVFSSLWSFAISDGIEWGDGAEV